MKLEEGDYRAPLQVDRQRPQPTRLSEPHPPSNPPSTPSPLTRAVLSLRAAEQNRLPPDCCRPRCRRFKSRPSHGVFVRLDSGQVSPPPPGPGGAAQ
ncbi:hypothetical protein PBY51_019634 [Eleginops maclovinus]|uniref:Uncharacterized protein n=1 Tax=Eleginops maclovinus TaxID=56733 RepID=A0AAN7XRN7_ELEMC|nr:hypothetical protein PBY51_019634 [Eleginops maclovinus]